MFFREVDLEPAALKTLSVLDAGCGNGQLTNALGAYADRVVGFDMSTSVDIAEMKRTADNVRFAHGDLENPPFDKESFDVVYCSGVLHHNPDTKAVFMAVADLVKPGGRFYCWLYRVDFSLLPIATLTISETVRAVVCRLPSRARDLAVRVYAGAYYTAARLTRPGRYSYGEMLVAGYDAITPRHAHRHNPFEVAAWFDEAAFDAPKLTHWDNKSGFGMVAVKGKRGQPAGIHFDETL